MAFAGQKFDSGLMDAVSGVGDPWVTALNTADLNRTLENLPRGPGGAVDYNAAAMKLLGRHPLASQQMLKIAQMRQSAGQHGADLQLRRDHLQILRDAENKPVEFEDDDGNKGRYRPLTGEAVYTSGVNVGRTFQMFQPGSFGTQRNSSGSTPQAPRPPAAAPTISPALQTPPGFGGGSATPQPTAPAPGPTSSMDQEDIELIRSVQGTPDYDRVVNIAAKKFGIPPQQVRLLAGGRSDAGQGGADPMMTEGGNMRVAGNDLQLPEGVGEAMGQATDERGLLPTPPRQPPAPLNPTQPYTEVYRAPGGKEDRLRAGAFNKELAEQEAKQQVQNREKAFQIRPLLENITHAKNAYDKVAAAGLNNMATGNPVVAGGLGIARGVYKTARGIAGKPPEEPGRIAGGIDAMSAFSSNIAQLEQLARQATRGQGALSEGEGKQLRETLPSLSSNDPKDVERAFKQIRGILVAAIRRGGVQVPDEEAQR